MQGNHFCIHHFKLSKFSSNCFSLELHLITEPCYTFLFLHHPLLVLPRPLRVSFVASYLPTLAPSVLHHIWYRAHGVVAIEKCSRPTFRQNWYFIHGKGKMYIHYILIFYSSFRRSWRTSDVSSCDLRCSGGDKISRLGKVYFESILITLSLATFIQLLHQTYILEIKLTYTYWEALCFWSLHFRNEIDCCLKYFKHLNQSYHKHYNLLDSSFITYTESTWNLLLAKYSTVWSSRVSWFIMISDSSLRHHFNCFAVQI